MRSPCNDAQKWHHFQTRSVHSSPGTAKAVLAARFLMKVMVTVVMMIDDDDDDDDDDVH